MRLHYKHILSSSSLHKNKEVLARNGGGEIGKEMYLNLYSMEESLFEHDTLSLALCLGWKFHLSPDHTPIILQIVLWSFLLSQYFQGSCRVINMFKEKFRFWISMYQRVTSFPFIKDNIFTCRFLFLNHESCVGLAITQHEYFWRLVFSFFGASVELRTLWPLLLLTILLSSFFY